MLLITYTEWSEGPNFITIGKTFRDHNGQRKWFLNDLKFKTKFKCIRDWFLFVLIHGKEHILRHKNPYLEKVHCGK